MLTPATVREIRVAVRLGYTDRYQPTQHVQALLAALAEYAGYVNCDAAHHAKHDRHEMFDPCPIEERAHALRAALREPLDAGGEG